MNGKDLIVKMKQIMSEHNVTEADLGREEFSQEVEDALTKELGEFKCVFHGRPPRGHDEMLAVYQFTKHDVYVAISGYYDSWSGTNWDEAELEQVTPVEKKYTCYEPVKS